jgi:hypothetical protein
MSITGILTGSCVQTAVYWGSPVDDGYGGKTFDLPVEIKCRWEDGYRSILGNNGATIGSLARVYVLEDLDEEGFLYLGTLADLDLDSSGYIDPKEVDKAWIIKRFEKSPALKSTTVFVRKVYLTS